MFFIASVKLNTEIKGTEERIFLLHQAPLYYLPLRVNILLDETVRLCLHTGLAELPLIGYDRCEMTA